MVRKWIAGAALVVAAGLTSGIVAQQTPPATPSSEVPRYFAPKVTWDADGTLHIPAHDLPPSEFMSPELKKVYQQHLASVAKWPGPPAMDAPMEVWHKYWKEFDDVIVGPGFNQTKEQFPAEIADKVHGGVRTKVVTPKSGIAPENKNRVMVNLHGGGFFTGAGLGMLQESLPVAGLMKIKVITIDYRMSPQHKFPAASEDVAAVYRELIKEYKPQNIGFYGCSAGGTLTAQAAAWFQAHGLPNPGAIGIFCSGGGNGGMRGDSTPWGSTGVFTPPQPRTTTAAPQGQGQGYMSSAKPGDPLAYPAASLKVLAKFPPTLFIAGNRAAEMSPAAYMNTRLLSQGVDSQLYLIEGGWHGVPQPGVPEGDMAHAYMTSWFSKRLGK
jgi:monoterpene epsilon-lactone hydrolase